MKYEIFNTYLGQDQVWFDWKDILLVEEVLTWHLRYGQYFKKKYVIWYFCFYRNKFARQFAK